METKKTSTKTMVLGAVLTALVVILQYMGSFIKFGPFSISLVLIPIVIGTATCGKKIGAWLGFVFGVVVLLSGDAAPFLAISVWGTVITVLLKGLLAGFMSGFIYEKLFKLSKSNTMLSAIGAAVVCPFVNTGIFLLGCVCFFMDTISVWAVQFGFGENIFGYMIFVLVGANFLFELVVNMVFAPIIVRLIKSVKF